MQGLQVGLSEKAERQRSRPQRSIDSRPVIDEPVQNIEIREWRDAAKVGDGSREHMPRTKPRDHERFELLDPGPAPNGTVEW